MFVLSKANNYAEILKQPLETAISIHTEDFEDFHMQGDMHIVISVRDFRAIVTHAETMRGSISAHFSFPTRPLQFSYQNMGMHCEYTLMTTGDYRGASSTPNPNFISTRSESRQPSVAPSLAASNKNSFEMPPPARPMTKKPLGSQTSRPALDDANANSARAQPEEPESDSLFIPGGEDDDQTWDPPNYEHEEEEEMLGWDASTEHPSASFHPTFRDSGSTMKSQPQKHPPPATESQEGLEPTQRLSQVRGHVRAPSKDAYVRLTCIVARHVRLNRLQAEHHYPGSRFSVWMKLVAQPAKTPMARP